VSQHDGQHPSALEHIKHPDGVDSAGLGCFHERFLPCAGPIPLEKKPDTAQMISFYTALP